MTSPAVPPVPPAPPVPPLPTTSSLAADLATVDTHTDLLLATVRALDPAQVAGPSLCEGWTKGHVLAHVSRNADALLNLVTSAVTGENVPMYASAEARDVDIEAGARRPLDEQITDLETSAARLRAASQGLTDDLSDHTVTARNNVVVRVGTLPFMRLREVVYHHADLGAGFGFDDVDPALALRFVQDQVRRLRARSETPSMTISTDEGDAWTIGDGEAPVSGPRSAVLAWLARGTTDGLVGEPPTLPFGG